MAQKYGITREQCDAFALQSQQRWQKAHEEGAFKDEIVPVEIKVKKVSLEAMFEFLIREEIQMIFVQFLVTHFTSDLTFPISIFAPCPQSTESFSVDEHPRGKTTLETLAKLPSVFKKDGTVTAGNASGICDGAAANIIAGEEALKRYGLKPLARVVSYGITACEPSIMGVSI